MYTIIHTETDEEFNVHFNDSWICGYATMDEALAAIKRLKAHEQYDREQEFYSYSNVGPSKSPSVVWDSIYWAD